MGLGGKIGIEAMNATISSPAPASMAPEAGTARRIHGETERPAVGEAGLVGERDAGERGIDR